MSGHRHTGHLHKPGMRSVSCVRCLAPIGKGYRDRLCGVCKRQIQEAAASLERQPTVREIIDQRRAEKAQQLGRGGMKPW